MLSRKELEQGKAKVPGESTGAWEVDVLMCPPTSTSMAAVDAVLAVADMGMTML